MKDVTLLFLRDMAKGEIVLAMKKRGFGSGKLNGVGGKVELGESVGAAAVREAHEEIGVIVAEEDLQTAGIIDFSFERKPEWDLRCHVFLADRWSGEPEESEEMAPQRFSIDAIPYERMWVDDRQWLPLVLAGNRIEAAFHFSNDGESILRQAITVL